MIFHRLSPTRTHPPLSAAHLSPMSHSGHHGGTDFPQCLWCNLPLSISSLSRLMVRESGWGHIRSYSRGKSKWRHNLSARVNSSWRQVGGDKKERKRKKLQQFLASPCLCLFLFRMQQGRYIPVRDIPTWNGSLGFSGTWFFLTWKRMLLEFLFSITDYDFGIKKICCLLIIAFYEQK